MFDSFTALANTPIFRTFGVMYDMFNYTAFIWGPILLVWLAQKLWLDYVRMQFIQKNFEFVLLEIKLPRVINKTPVAPSIAKNTDQTLLASSNNLTWYKNAIKILSKGTSKIVIMHCILNYPTKDEDANLKMIDSLKKEFPNYAIGYSDHTLPNEDMLNLTTAYILGANVIEKHFTLNKKFKGNDHYHAMDAKDLNTLTKKIRKIEEVTGNCSKKKFIKSELISRKFARRCLVAKKNLYKNCKIKEGDVIALRPNVGISAVHWESVIGKKLKRNVKINSAIKWRDI